MSETDGGTSAKIVATARGLFHARGYHDVGVNDVCSAAGVAKGSFYHFFPSKDALLEAVIERNRRDLLDSLHELARSGATGRDQLLAQLHGVVMKAREQKRGGAVLGCDIGTLASELSAANEVGRKAARRAFREWFEALEAAVRTGIDDGSLAPELDPRRTAMAFLAVLQGMSTLGRTFNEPAQLKAIARHAEATLLPGP